jgi:hypothetical protein
MGGVLKISMQQTRMNNDIILFLCKSVSAYYLFGGDRQCLALNIIAIQFVDFFLNLNAFEPDENNRDETGYRYTKKTVSDCL